jgi:uncharacterized protein (TIGR00730 family)
MENFRKTPTTGLVPEEVKKICRGLAPKDREKQLLCVIEEETKQGFEFLKEYPRIVTILGSARTPEGDPYYEAARECGARLVEEFGVAVATGGGPGIMEAANRGAQEVGGKSLGIGIALPHEQGINPYVTGSLTFHFFFTRKVIMSYAAKAYIFFPGGYGTLNELFEFLTLVQTEKVPAMPIYLYGSEYWNPLLSLVEDELRGRRYIDPKDEHLFIITDSLDEIMEGLAHFLKKEEPVVPVTA